MHTRIAVAIQRETTAAPHTARINTTLAPQRVLGTAVATGIATFAARSEAKPCPEPERHSCTAARAHAVRASLP